MICFDNETTEKTWRDVVDFGVKADPELIARLRYIDFYLHRYKVHVTITSFMREDGVHNTGRAADIRSRDLSESACKLLEDHVNNLFPRRDKKPTVLYHNVKGFHFHVQVPAKI